MRRFTWEDLPGLSGLLNRLGRHGFRRWPETPAELRHELESMRLDVERDLFLLQDGASTCGYSLSLVEPDINRVVASVGILPECIGRAGELLDRCIERARHSGMARIHIATQHESAEPVQLLRDRGFHEVTANLEMVLTPGAVSGLEAELLPGNFTIRPMKSSSEVLLLTRVQNAVFAGHWGFSRNAPEEVQARLDLPSTGPSDVLFAESEEGDVAAYIWTAREPNGDQLCGRVWMTGVMPDFRQGGLGKAIIRAGIRHLFATAAADVHLEVMSHNEPAVSIYRQMGFITVGHITWYELRAH